MKQQTKDVLVYASELMVNCDTSYSCDAIITANYELFKVMSQDSNKLCDDYANFYGQVRYHSWLHDEPSTPNRRLIRSLLLLLYAEVGELE